MIPSFTLVISLVGHSINLDEIELLMKMKILFSSILLLKMADWIRKGYAITFQLFIMVQLKIHHIQQYNTSIRLLSTTIISVNNYSYSRAFHTLLGACLRPIRGEESFIGQCKDSLMHENEAHLSSVKHINRAFDIHSIGGERAASLMGHWRLFFENHQNFLDA